MSTTLRAADAGAGKNAAPTSAPSQHERATTGDLQRGCGVVIFRSSGF
jgi:hypothetical protein